MRTSPKVTIYIITAGVALLCVAGHKEEPDNSKDLDDIPPSHITTQTHKTGETVKIACHYPDSHVNNVKYLCKGEKPLNCGNIIQTTEGERDVKEGRFDIRDNKRKMYFYVYIHNLNAADSGTYWCGSDKEPLHNKIHLSVDGGNIKTKKSDPSNEQTTPAPHPDEDDSYFGMIAGVVTCLVLLVIVVIVLIVYRNKLPGAKGGSSEQRANSGQNTEDNHEYEDIRERNQLPSSGGAVSSVYAVVNPPADQLHYASVSFQNDSATVSKDRNALPDTDKNGSSACDYSSISRTQQGGTNPPVLYSAVTKPGEP